MVGGVADAHRPRAGEPGQVGQPLLDQLALAADAVERLQRPVVGHAEQELDEALAFDQMRQPPQRLDDERGVAQPAVAVVPGPLGAERLGDAGRGRGDDRAGVEVGVQLQAQRRAQHHLRPEGRQRAALRPRPPAGHGQLERVLDRRRVVHVGRPAGAQGEVVRHDRRGTAGPRRWSSRPGSSAGTAAAVRRAPRGPRRSPPIATGRPGVVGSRVEDHPQPRRVAVQRAHEPVDLDRRVHAQAGRDARREVEHLAAALAGLDHRADDVGVDHVGHRPSWRRARRRSGRCRRAASSSSRANTDGLSKRGRHSQSIPVSGPTSASTLPLPMAPWPGR